MTKLLSARASGLGVPLTSGPHSFRGQQVIVADHLKSLDTLFGSSRYRALPLT